jgi:HEPN domain-containing protein
MDETKGEWVRTWLIKAHSDLRSARALVALPEPATDTAIYHCQQVAEKALKVPFSSESDPRCTRVEELAWGTRAFKP